MSELDDDILLNAYLDGELDAQSKRAVERRLRGEPDLQATLNELRYVSQAVKRLYPVGDDKPKTRSIRKPALVAAGAVAAAIAVAFFGVSMFGPTTPATLLSQHRGFTQQSYELAGEEGFVMASGLSRGVPDLSAANLRIVDILRDENGQILFHYSGVNGCRLTLGVHPDDPPSLGHGEGILSQVWHMGGRHYSLVAEGMDSNKFAAISVLLLRWSTTQGPDGDTVLAVHDATSSARPCA